MKYHTHESKDIAHWVTMTMLQLGRAPTVAALQTRYDLSRPTTYRWQSWAREKLAAMKGVA
jgi:hypothetical protein